MRFYIYHFICITFLLSTMSLARSVNEPHFKILDRRGHFSKNTGYECGSKKYKMVDVNSAVRDACVAYPKNKRTKSLWTFFQQKTRPISFPEAQKFGFPRDSQMAPMTLSFLEFFGTNSVVFSASDCKLLGLVSKKKDKKNGLYQSCKFITWPFGFLDLFEPPIDN
ncbi:BgTH12-00255 [Blumeria graminis f. sp. triticale]|uniref:BgtE-5570 n=2 Tax=Blumeria graminis TaxID=34373 RepID=A0A9X9MLE2_BLUGR|nr:BgTH12-00255 [Blumeria graminis f. sp. triticale]VDB92772.1 BgtE-5570 [Blumeria graminis f. sp. tritici]